MSKNFGIQESVAPQKALWNYNLQRTASNGGVYLKAGTLNVDKGVTLPIGTQQFRH